MSREFGQWVPIAKNGEQIGIWVDPSLAISRGGVLGVRTDDRSFLSTGENGVTATVGDGATVTTGSPRRLVVQPDPAIARIAKVVDSHTADIATKAAQSDMETAQSDIADLQSTKASTDLASKGTPGLVLQAEDPGDISGGATLADVIAAVNNILAAQRDAGQVG